MRRTAPTRPLTPEEEALLGVVSGVAREPLDEGWARLEVDWRQWDDGPVWPDFSLAPSEAGACPVTVSPSGGDWIDFTFGPRGAETTFELWAESESERLALLRECLQAVVEGRFEVTLERLPRLLSLGRHRWRVVGMFQLPRGPTSYSRQPVEPEEYRAIFGDTAVRSRTAKRIGPQRFSPYRPT